MLNTPSFRDWSHLKISFDAVLLSDLRLDTLNATLLGQIRFQHLTNEVFTMEIWKGLQ